MTYAPDQKTVRRAATRTRQDESSSGTATDSDVAPQDAEPAAVEPQAEPHQAGRQAERPERPRIKATVSALSFWYDDFQALREVELPIHDQQVTALIGASGCGKSTLLRCFNRMHDLYSGNRYQGEIRLHPEDINL
ncbi:MAG: ATP-binding cassette domain-containing protein, partial [Halofilum sp. (in: g-proteobacteria)]